jgi:hypothetical protein
MRVNSVASLPIDDRKLSPRVNAITPPPPASTKKAPDGLHDPIVSLENILPESVRQVINKNPNDVSAIIKAFQVLSSNDQRSFLENSVRAGIKLGLDVNQLSNEKLTEIFNSEEFANTFLDNFALARDIASTDNSSTTDPVSFINKLIRELSQTTLVTRNPDTATRNPDTATFASAA